MDPLNPINTFESVISHLALWVHYDLLLQQSPISNRCFKSILIPTADTVCDLPMLLHVHHFSVPITRMCFSLFMGFSLNTRRYFPILVPTLKDQGILRPQEQPSTKEHFFPGWPKYKECINSLHWDEK